MKRVGLFLLAIAAARAGDSDNRLIEAAMQDDLDGVRALLAQHVDVNAAEGDGATALHWAAMRGDPEMVELLLKAGARMGERERMEYYGRPLMSDGDLPLHNPATVTERIQDTETNVPTPTEDVTNTDPQGA